MIVGPRVQASLVFLVVLLSSVALTFVVDQRGTNCCPVLRGEVKRRAEPRALRHDLLSPVAHLEEGEAGDELSR